MEAIVEVGAPRVAAGECHTIADVGLEQPCTDGIRERLVQHGRYAPTYRPLTRTYD
jgi:hypothetical protein